MSTQGAAHRTGAERQDSTLEKLGPFVSVDQLSQEMAAEVAGLDRTDFLMALARRGVDAFSMDFQDLERELDRG
jgi:hypothetical protein